jgi:VanZ family protein
LARFLRFWLPPLIYVVLIFAVSGTSSPQVPFNIDSNLLHYPEYAALSFLLIRAIQSDKPGVPSILQNFLALLLSALWGFLDEVHQAFVPGRVPDAADFLHDAIGAAIGLSAFFLLKFTMIKFRPRTE